MTAFPSGGRTDLAKFEREYGAAAADNTERRRPTMRGFKIAHRRVGKQLRTARARVAQLFEQRRDVPKRVEFPRHQREGHDAALTKALPRLLREVRDLVGERRVTIVFDRGGWSPRLFATMIKDGFDLLTYRKGRSRRINARRFIRRRAELDECWVDYLLHDQPVGFMKGKLRLRQVTRLCDDGHQTQVITS